MSITISTDVFCDCCKEGYLEPDQPSPASHEQWRRHQLAQHGRDFTPMERWKIRLATGLVTPGGDDAE